MIGEMYSQSYRNFQKVLYTMSHTLNKGLCGTYMITDKNGRTIYVELTEDDQKVESNKGAHTKFIKALDDIQPEQLDFSEAVRTDLLNVKYFKPVKFRGQFNKFKSKKHYTPETFKAEADGTPKKVVVIKKKVKVVKDEE